MALARNVQPWAEIDASLQEQQMKLALKVGSGVSSEEFGFEIHLLDPVHHRAQAIMEQAEYLVFVLVVLTADCSAEPLAELLEPRSKQFLSSKFLPRDGSEEDIKRKSNAYRLRCLHHSKHNLCLIKQHKIDKNVKERDEAEDPQMNTSVSEQ